MQIICRPYLTEPAAYRWQAWSPDFCSHDWIGYGSTKHHAIQQLKRALGAPKEPDDIQRSERRIEHLIRERSQAAHHIVEEARDEIEDLEFLAKLGDER